MKEVRVGIIGIGNMGSAHAVNIFDGKVQNMHLSAVCDIDDKKLDWAKERLDGVSLYRNYKEMYASGDVDAVIIATPHKNHCWHREKKEYSDLVSVMQRTFLTGPDR